MVVKIDDPRVPGIVAPLLASLFLGERFERARSRARESSRRDARSPLISALRYLMRRTLDGKHYEHRDAYNVFLSSPSPLRLPRPPRNRSRDDLFLYSARTLSTVGAPLYDLDFNNRGGNMDLRRGCFHYTLSFF